VLTPDEEAALLSSCGRLGWLKPIVTVALNQALRMGEVAGLSWSDVDFKAGMLTVRASLGRDGKLGPPKGKKVCTIPLTPAARAVLVELRGDSDGTGFVFRNSIGGARQLRDIGRAFEKVRDRAGLGADAGHEEGPVTFHCLRHTGISRLANHPQIPLVAVRDFARHSNLTTTQGYVHAIESDSVTAAIGEALAGVKVA
jgi:integrase